MPNVNNFYPHGMEGGHAKIACRLTNFIERFCDAKVAHSGHLSAKGYVYIPHPLYDLDESLNFQGNGEFDNKISDYYVIFGRIARYKKIETIIERWDSEVPLLIAGSGSDDAYLNGLKKLAEGKSVIFDARFIEDVEAQELVAKSKGMILAHADPDMIVSGSFFYAVTLGTPVYAVEKPFFRWLKKEKSFDGLHLYETPKKLVDDLTSFKEGSSFRDEPSSNDVRRQAESLFGDAAVRNAWHDLLTRMA